MGRHMAKHTISKDTLGLLISLVVSVWWIFMGLDLGFRFEAPDTVSYLLTLGGTRHTVMTVAALVLIPICAREIRWGAVLAAVLATVTFLLTAAHVVYMVVTKPAGFEDQLFGPIVWALMQLPIVFFGRRAAKR
jgi:hypothetical protein